METSKIGLLSFKRFKELCIEQARGSEFNPLYYKKELSAVEQSFLHYEYVLLSLLYKKLTGRQLGRKLGWKARLSMMGKRRVEPGVVNQLQNKQDI